MLLYSAHRTEGRGVIMHICGALGAAAPFIGILLVGGGAGIVTIMCILNAARLLLRPGEAEPDHPKRRILALDR
jgi:hypothetical protein